MHRNNLISKLKPMAYNITNSKIKRIESLVIPVKELYTHEREDWHPKQPTILNLETGQAKIEDDFEHTITGILKDGHIHVENMDLSGEGSGTYLSWILMPALKKSKGVLEAIFVWEGGDSTTRLTVNDGQVVEEDVYI